MKYSLYGLGFCLFASIAFFSFIYFASARPIEIINKFLVFAHKNEIDEAYKLTSKQFQTISNRDQTKSFLERNGLLAYEDVSWHSRSLKLSGSAELKGTVTTTDGTSLPIEVIMVKDNFGWKVHSITVDKAAAKVEVNEELVRPSDDELSQMVKLDIQGLGEAINSDDYSAYYFDFSEMFKERYGKEKLREIFGKFKTNEVDLTALRNLDPVFSSKPIIDEHGGMQVVGYFATKPTITRFSFDYVYEHQKWKKAGLRVVKE